MEPGVSREANEEAGAVERTKPSLMSPLESIFAINLHQCNNRELSINNVSKKHLQSRQ